MTVRRLLLPVLAVLALSAGACSRARSAPPSTAEGDAGAVVARVGGRAITQREVDARAAGALLRLKSQEYEARRKALDDLIVERLLDEAAAGQRVSREELLRREVEARVARPTPEEIARVYEANKSRAGGRSREELAPEIERSLVQQRSAERAEAFMEELRRKAGVQVTLPQPRSEVAIPADALTLGPANAPVTIVEFSDYLCPYCQRAQSVVEQVLDRNQGKVRFVHRDFLLGRPRSMAVARAAQCAGDQGKFWVYRHGLLTQPGDWSDQDLVGRTSALGLEARTFQACLASDRHDRVIRESSDQGTQLGVDSTPTFFINGRRIRGVRSVEEFQEVIDAELRPRG